MTREHKQQIGVEGKGVEKGIIKRFSSSCLRALERCRERYEEGEKQRRQKLIDAGVDPDKDDIDLSSLPFGLPR